MWHARTRTVHIARHRHGRHPSLGRAACEAKAAKAPVPVPTPITRLGSGERLPSPVPSRLAIPSMIALQRSGQHHSTSVGHVKGWPALRRCTASVALRRSQYHVPIHMVSQVWATWICCARRRCSSLTGCAGKLQRSSKMSVANATEQHWLHTRRSTRLSHARHVRGC